MRNRSRIATLLAATLWTMFNGMMLSASHPKNDQELQLTIRVYDYAGVPAPALDQMKGELEWLLRKAGTRLEWLACRGADESDRQGRCTASILPSELILRIIGTSAGSVLPQLDSSALGFTTAKEAHGGNMVTVSLQGAEALAALRVASLGKVLASIVAHEIGHVFLGSQHSALGIMRPQFRSAELAQMKMRQLTFSSEQLEGLTQAITKRAEAGLAATTIPAE